jgi:hypothetical protein
MALCTALFTAFVGALLVTVFELHPTCMPMLLPAALLVVLLAGAGTVGWGWYAEDTAAALWHINNLYYPKAG